MVDYSTNINKMNNIPSPQTIEQEQDKSLLTKSGGSAGLKRRNNGRNNFIIPSPTKLERDIVTLPSVLPSSFRNILLNTLESISFNGFWPNLVHFYKCSP